jgi:hypothetical protein
MAHMCSHFGRDFPERGPSAFSGISLHQRPRQEISTCRSGKRPVPSPTLAPDNRSTLRGVRVAPARDHLRADLHHLLPHAFVPVRGRLAVDFLRTDLLGSGRGNSAAASAWRAAMCARTLSSVARLLFLGIGISRPDQFRTCFSQVSTSRASRTRSPLANRHSAEILRRSAASASDDGCHPAVTNGRSRPSSAAK